MPDLTPYIAVADARGALDWYRSALGAEISYEPIVMPDGRVGHAELTFPGDGARLMLSDAHPEIGVVAPEPGRTSVTLHLVVADCDVATDRCVTAGARLDRPPTESAGGLAAVVTDPYGHRWMLRQE